MAEHSPRGGPAVSTGDFNALHDMPARRYLSGDLFCGEMCLLPFLPSVRNCLKSIGNGE
jgi:hypothetical protein